jgi:hypothetical protein
MTRRLIPVGLLLAAVTDLGCGPNYRYAYEGEAAFERCYALDYESAVTPGDRAGCWSAWLQHYSYGANPDRLDYARSRLTASSVAGPQSATLNPTSPNAPIPAAPSVAPPQLAAPILANTPAATPPAPTPAAPRPPGLPLTAPPATSAAPAASGDPPGSSCANECRSSWGSCGGGCTRRDAACEARCDDVYRDCMRGCY